MLSPEEAAELLRSRKLSSNLKRDGASNLQLSEKCIQSSAGPSSNNRTLLRWVKSCFLGIGRTEEENPSMTSLEESDESVKVVDLRSAQDFSDLHIHGAHQISLDGPTPGAAGGVDLFANAGAVHAVWTNLQMLFKTYPVAELFSQAKCHSTTIIILCYNGEVSRLATSILRGKGVEAFSIRGGVEELWKVIDVI